MSPYQSVILEMKSRETPLAAELITVLLLLRDTISKSTYRKKCETGVLLTVSSVSLTIIGGA